MNNERVELVDGQNEREGCGRMGRSRRLAFDVRRAMAPAAIAAVLLAVIGASIGASAAANTAAGIGAGQALAGQTSSGPFNLDLAGSIELALRLNPGHRAALLDLEYARMELTRAEADNALNASATALRQAQAKAASAGTALEVQERQLRLDVQTAYFGALNADAGLELAKKSVEQAKDSLRIVKLKKNEGLATNLDVLNAEKILLQAENGLATARDTAALACLNLARALGVDLNAKLDLKDEEFQYQKLAINEDEFAKKALAASFDLRQKRDSLEVAQMQARFSSNDYTAPLVARMAANRSESAGLAAVEAEREVMGQVKGLINSLRQAEASLKLAQKEQEIDAENYRVTKARYENGLEISNTLLAAQVQLDRSRQAARQALFDYLLARTRLLNYLGE